MGGEGALFLPRYPLPNTAFLLSKIGITPSHNVQILTTTPSLDSAHQCDSLPPNRLNNMKRQKNCASISHFTNVTHSSFICFMSAPTFIAGSIYFYLHRCCCPLVLFSLFFFLKSAFRPNAQDNWQF